VSFQASTSWGLDSGADGINWRLRGACMDPAYDANLWTSPKAEDRGQAVWICNNVCAVRITCRRWADQNRPLARDSIYGGILWTSPRNRTEVRPCGIQPVPRRPTGEPAADPRPTPASDADRIAWLWAAGVPLVDIVKRIGCSGQDVAQRIAELGKTPKTPPRQPTAKCGSRSGRERHKRLGEPICDQCLAAEARYRQERRAGATA
jgi:hypothetical protein